jgi:hypothetical protein
MKLTTINNEHDLAQILFKQHVMLPLYVQQSYSYEYIQVQMLIFYQTYV